MCLLTNERYKTYQTGFSFDCLGHAPGVGPGGTMGVGRVNFFSEINQSWCVSYLHEWHMQRHNFWGPPPGALGRDHRSNIIKSQLLSQFKDFETNLIWLVMIKMTFLLLNNLNDINCGHVRKCVMRSIIFWTKYL